MDLRGTLKGKLTEKEMTLLRTSFDVVGDVAIMEIPTELVRKEKIIAEALMSIHKHVKTVCRKDSKRSGELRLRRIKYIAGRRSTETLHTEFGCRYKLDVRKTYFSPRESTERDRIASLVKEGENVMVMFAGVGPFAILIAKRRDVQAYSVELNRAACKYAEENIHLNHVAARVDVICGDVRKVCRPYYGSCDRVVMPLPKEGWKFLDVAFGCLGKSGMVHFYFAGSFEDAEKHVKEAAKKAGRTVKIARRVEVLPYAPHIMKVCLDVKVN